ncbi:hypothetical protein PTKIN_Ptkin18bG0064200 [Pterospermum kingtungense]
MKGSEKKVSFSSPPITKISASPKGTDENDRINQEMGLNLQNPKRQTMKHFMSPTVSAVSKATFPRKKILADRNESLGSNSSNTHLSKTPNLDSKPSPKSLPKASPKNSPSLDPKVTSSSSQKTPLSYNSRDETPSPRPYDPLTNYLSPRPQFLRYNPSRRKEIFLRLETEDKEGDDNELSVSSSSASFDSKKAADDEAESDSSSLASSSLLEDEESGDEIGTLLEQEDEVSDFESEEEAEEEVGLSLRGVLQYLLLLVVLVLTTSYISSMNSPTSAPAFQGLTHGQNQSFGIVEVGYKFLDEKREQLGLLGLNQAIVDDGIEEETIRNVNMGEIVSLELEDRNVESIEMVEEVKRDDEYAREEAVFKSGEASDQFVEDVDLQEKETVEKIKEVEEAEGAKENGEESQDEIEEELAKTGEVSEQLVEDIELQEIEESGEQIVDVKENGEGQEVIEEELVKKGKVSDQIVGVIELLGQETAGEIDFLQGDQTCLLAEGSDDQQEVASHTTDSSEINKVVSEESGEEIFNEATDNYMIQGEIIGSGHAISMASAVSVVERWGKYVTLSFNELKGLNQHLGTEILVKYVTLSFNELKGLNQHLGTEILVKALFGVFTCAAIVASLVLGSNIRRKGVASKHSSQVDKHSTKPVVKEKPSLVLPDEREEHKMHVNSFLNTMPLIGSTSKDMEETYQSRAPSVELLGEFEVAGISRSCAIQNGLKDRVSSYSDVLDNDLGIKAYSTPVQHQHDFSDLSTVNSSSSEGLTTAKKKLLKKEFGNNDMVTTTPLRRSARLRNYSVASP